MNTAQLSDPDAAVAAGLYGAPNCRARGSAEGALFHPEGYSLWRVVGELSDDAVLEWDTEHGDEAIFVQAGWLDSDGTAVGEGSTLVVEAGVPWLVRFVGPTRIVHFGTIATTSPTNGILGAPATDGRGIHIVRAEEAASVHFEGGDDATSLYFCDGTCPTCRLTLFLYGSEFAPGYAGVSHFHSEDEIIHVLDGELHVGPLTVGPGAAIAVPRDLRYSLRSTGPYRYLDYRADVSTAVVQPGSEPVLETVANLKRFGG
jgi:hypothetical protein